MDCRELPNENTIVNLGLTTTPLGITVSDVSRIWAIADSSNGQLSFTIYLV